MARGYPISTLKRWNKEGISIVGRPKEERKCDMKYRKVTPTEMDWKVKEILREDRVETVSKKNNTLFTRLRNEKDVRDKLETPGIYTIPLTRGSETKEYIGRTLKGVNVRLNQHRDDVRKKVGTTTFANAVNFEGWAPHWEKTRVLSRPSTLMRSVLAEYMEIRKAGDNAVNALEESDRLEKWRVAAGKY